MSGLYYTGLEDNGERGLMVPKCGSGEGENGEGIKNNSQVSDLGS